MKILVRNENQNNWKMVQSFAYGNEAELQRLLSETPALIPIGDIREDAGELIATIREFTYLLGQLISLLSMQKARSLLLNANWRPILKVKGKSSVRCWNMVRLYGE